MSVQTIDYEEIEELKALKVAKKNKQLTDEFFVLSMEELLTSVQVLRPTRLSETFYLACSQESAIDTQHKKSNPVLKPSRVQLHSWTPFSQSEQLPLPDTPT